MIRKLRKKFIRIATVAVTLVLVLLGLILNIANYISVNAELTQMLQAIYNNQGIVPSAPPGGDPGGKRDGQFTQETPYSTRYFVLRYTGEGDLVNADLRSIAAVTEADTGEYLAIALRHGEGFGYTRGYKYYVVHSGGGRYMAIFLDSYREMRSLALTAVLSLAATAVCIALVYGIVVLYSHRAIDPVVQAAERQKQFITDAGHELKTPITVIATCLTVLEMETGQQKWIDKARAQTDKLKKLVNSLITLSRMDEENSPLTLQSFDASAAIGEAAGSFTDFAAQAGHELQLSIPAGLTYCGDEYAIRQLVSILLDNAVKYADEGTPIRFSLQKGRRGIVLRCENACTGLDPAQLPRIFDRFYRGDKARSGAGGSFGIGLSIARSIAEGHHGSIRAESPDGCRILFTAELK